VDRSGLLRASTHPNHSSDRNVRKKVSSLTSDDYAALYAEIKGKIAWALRSSLPFSLSYPHSMDWSAHYASDALEQYKAVDEHPDYRPYTRNRKMEAQIQEALDKKR